MSERTLTACAAVSDEEMDRIDRAASRRGLSRSEFIRSAALFCAGLQDRPEAGRRVRAILADARSEAAADPEPEPTEEEATR